MSDPIGNATRSWVVLLLLLALGVGSAFAAGPSLTLKQIESSLLVNGTIDITADGTVAGYALKNGEALPSGIKSMVARVVPQWRFEPVRLGPDATSARATMSLRFVAKELGDKKFSIEIRSAQFGKDVSAQSNPRRDLIVPPTYPPTADESGVGGTVYTVLKIGKDGHVEDAMAEQVNLRIAASENVMRRWRGVFAKAALSAARNWRFLPPTEGEQVDAPYWLVRIPITFVPRGFAEPVDHQWHAYVPGPRADIPWTDDESQTGADAIAAGGVYPMDGGPRLLTSLNPS